MSGLTKSLRGDLSATAQIFEAGNPATGLDALYFTLLDVDSIRLLHLYPGGPDEPLVADLKTTNLKDAPPYEAMSYTWGNRKLTAEIMIGSAKVNILMNLHMAIRRVRHISRPRILWTDALCINQSNPTERSHQVSIMGTIYKKAKRVLIWLGEDADGNSDSAVHFLHYMESWIDKYAKPVESGNLGSDLMWDPQKLTSHETAHWEGLACLFNQPWFSRVWTLQEVGFSRDASFFYGNAETSFISVMKVLIWLETGGQLLRLHFGIRPDPRYGFCVLFYKGFDPALMRSLGCLNRKQIADFLAVLKYTRSFGASDPRDRIYAFLGLSTALTGVEHAIEVDYNKSADTIFTEFARNYVKQPSGLRILSHVYEGEITSHGSETPSWVPVWDQPKPTLELGSKLHYYHAGGIRDHPPVWIDDDILMLQGCILDSIAWTHIPFTSAIDLTSHAPKHLAKFHELELLWSNMLGEILDLKLPYDDLHVALSLTLVAGLTGLGPAEEDLRLHFANFCSYLLELRILKLTSDPASDRDEAEMLELRESAKGGSWAQYMVDSLRVCQSRRFFCTKKGYFGIGPDTLLAGDVCCVLYGATVPFIIRKVGSQYLLIGESYIQGFMRGEVLKLCQCSELTEETVHIR